MEKILRDLNTSIYNTRLEVRNLSEDPRKLSKAAIDFVERLQYKTKEEGQDLALVYLDTKYEHANWINVHTIRKMLGGELNESYIIKTNDDTHEEFVRKILREHGKFVAVVDSNHVYESLVDRFAMVKKITQKLS
jgi:hypothetical protein